MHHSIDGGRHNMSLRDISRPILGHHSNCLAVRGPLQQYRELLNNWQRHTPHKLGNMGLKAPLEIGLRLLYTKIELKSLVSTFAIANLVRIVEEQR
jgi:hypothetical protein